MLRITVQRDASMTTLKLEGKISGDWVIELSQTWLAECNGTKSIQIDLTGVTFVSDEGKKLLGRIFEQGCVLHARDCMNRSTIEEIWRKHRQNGRMSHNLLTKVLRGHFYAK